MPPGNHDGFGPPPGPSPGLPGGSGPRRNSLFLALAVIVALGIVAVVLVVNRGGGSSQRKQPGESSPSRSAVPSLGIPSELPTTLPTALPTAPPTALPSKLPSALPTSLPPGFPSEVPSDIASFFSAPAA